MVRERALKIVLVLIGLLFTAGIYPIIMILWHRDQTGYTDAMMLSLYFTLGILLLRSVKDPLAHRSLIAFAAWSSFAHAGRHGDHGNPGFNTTRIVVRCSYSDPDWSSAHRAGAGKAFSGTSVSGRRINPIYVLRLCWPVCQERYESLSEDAQSSSSF